MFDFKISIESKSLNNLHVKRSEEYETVTLDTDAHGRVSLKCQVTDYRLRGEALGDSNVIDFFINTYEVNNTSDNSDNLPDLNHMPRRGRSCHDRVLYLPEHPKFECKQRVLHGKHHNNLPNFIGHYFPRHDDPDEWDFYCASMLMLLKPWRRLETNLKSPTQTWELAFELFLSTAPQRVSHILSGIQYFHEHQSSAKQQSSCQAPSTRIEDTGSGELDLEEDHDPARRAGGPLTEDGLAQLIALQIPWREKLHGRLAVETARLAKIFNTTALQLPEISLDHAAHVADDTTEGSDQTLQSASLRKHAQAVTQQDIQNLLLWK